MNQLEKILANYNVNHKTIQAINVVRKQLRHSTKLKEIEFAAMFELNSGIRVNGIIAGEETQADILKHLNLLQTSKKYIQIHTHPKNSTFSLDDLILLLEYDEISSMVVVGKDRVTYVLIKVEHGFNRTYINDLIKKEFQSLKPKYQKKLFKKGISEKRMLALLLNEVLENVCPQLGLKYFCIKE